MTIVHCRLGAAPPARHAPPAPSSAPQPRMLPLTRLAGAALLCLATSACSVPAAAANRAPASPAAPAPAPVPAASAAAATPAAKAADAPSQEQTALWRQIQTEVGDAACDAPQQCRSGAVGSKACGGPSAYLAWSTRRSDAGKMAALLAQHAAAARRANQASDLMSTCEVVSDPGATCTAGRCVLLPRGLGGGDAR